MVTITVTEESTFVFVVRNGRVSIVRADLGKQEIDDAVAALRDAFIVRGSSVFEFDLGLSYRLYNALFGPVEEQLAGVRHMVYVPTGSLLSLPLGILVRKPPVGESTAGYLNAAWLARDMSVSILPSVRSFVDLRLIAGRSRAPRPFVGFGNPIFDGFAAPVRVTAAPSDLPSGEPVRHVSVTTSGPANPAAHFERHFGTPFGRRPQEEGELRTRNLSGAMDALCAGGQLDPSKIIRQLAPLPETEDELLRVSSILGGTSGDVITRTQASEAQVKATDLSQYRVIYFATHGLLPGELRCQAEAALAMTPPSQSGDETDDGLLATSDIARLNLDADLVVLSACNTGGPSGKMGGEALSGLARSFFYAGARRLMVSHWVVPSLATVQLTTGMFERFSSVGSSESLRQAQLALIDDPRTAHPFFWGAFTIVGDGGQQNP
ncbi:MAG: CHAT domain-containing protein [Pseudomonadota bacterium]